MEEEFSIPDWVQYNFKLVARYKHEITPEAGGEINKKGYVAVSYFDGAERVYFDIVKIGDPIYNYKHSKPEHEFIGWYLDDVLTQPYDFSDVVNKASENISLYLKTKKLNNQDPNSQEHKITFITPSDVTQLVPTYRKHGEKLDTNYSLPSMVTRLLPNGDIEELDYWTIVDPITAKDTGVRFDFKTPITQDLILNAHLKRRTLPVQEAEITYTVKKEEIDGTFTETTLTKKAVVGSKHTVDFQNPNQTVFQDPIFSQTEITVNPKSSENKVVITLKRKVHKVEFEVKGHSAKIADRSIKHGAKVGLIDETPFALDELGIVKIELNGILKTKAEIETLTVEKDLKITLYIGEPTKKLGKYPQTKVDNPEGISHLKDEVRELKFNSRAKDYTLKFTRSYWQDSQGNKYEKYDGIYYKFEDVEFIKIPKKNTWFTKKILDITAYNIAYLDFPDNAKPENSLFRAMLKEISAFLGVDAYGLTFDDGDFGVQKLDFFNPPEKMLKKPTDFAKAVHGDRFDHQNIYRGTDLTPFIEANGFGPFYLKEHIGSWWLDGQWEDKDQAYCYRYESFLDGNYLNYLTTQEIAYTYGIVVGIR